MKYLFVIHSHTLFLTSLGTVDSLGLNRDDVVFLYTRGYRTSLPTDGCREIIADDAFRRYEGIKTPEHRPQIRALCRSFDRMVPQWTGGEAYELFVPHLWNPFFKLLQTNRNCVKVSLVQEGAFTVETYFHNHFSCLYRCRLRLMEFLRWGSLRLYGNGWYTDGEIRRRQELDAYAVYPEFFQYLKGNIHLVRWPSVTLSSSVQPTDGPVFIFDGFVTHHYCDESFYLTACRRLVETFAGSRNYLKFHPAQPAAEREAICALFRANGQDFTLLEDTVPFELTLLSCQGMTLVGFGSSLLYFAKAAGHSVHCCDTWLMDDPLFSAYHQAGVPFFNEYFSDERQ